MEIEAKYVVLDPRTYTTLTRLHQIADFQLAEGGTRSILDRYLDTPDHAIFSAGYACRLRRQNDETVITVKSLSTPGEAQDDLLHRRIELQISLDEGLELTPSRWPKGPLHDLVLEAVGEQELTEILEIKQARQVRYLLDSDENTIAELDLDQVQIRGGQAARGKSTGGKSSGDRPAYAFTELEIELMEGGNEADLKQVMAHLSRMDGLVAQPTSKFERGLALVAGGSVTAHHRRSIKPRQMVGEATRILLRTLFLKMQLHEEGTYAGADIEELHDMRVAIRRMRTLLRVTKGYIDLKALGPVCTGLRQTGRVLGAVRDMDVFREKTEAYLAQSETPPHTLAPLMQVWNVEYAHRRNDMLTYLGDRDYARFKQRFWGHLERKLPTRGKPARVSDVVHDVIAAQLRRLQDSSASIGGPVQDYEAYHQVRIDAKLLRYSLEFFRGVLGAEAQKAIEVLKHLQDHFGDLQDAVVAAHHLRAVTAYGTWTAPRQTHLLWKYADGSDPIDAASRDAIWAYLSAREAEVEVLTAATPQVWQQFQDRTLPELVEAALAGSVDAG
jgi:CHAD domain-containing protein